jgi:hypothetical protein
MYSENKGIDSASYEHLTFWGGIMEKRRRDWRELCEAALKEKDPKRLLALVKELNEVLDETQNGRSKAFTGRICRDKIGCHTRLGIQAPNVDHLKQYENCRRKEVNIWRT